MFTSRMLTLATAGLLALGAGCSRYGTAGGDVASISPAEAANTVTLVTMNNASTTMELRVIAHGQSSFVGSVGAHDRGAILLDPSILPAGDLYVVGIPADGRGRVVEGPLAVGKGMRIDFTIESDYTLSRAVAKP